jgi:hypothetical protein
MRRFYSSKLRLGPRACSECGVAIADERIAKEFSLFSLDVNSARTTTGVEDGPIYPKLYLQLKYEPIATSSSVGRSTLQTHPRLSSRLADA